MMGLIVVKLYINSLTSSCLLSIFSILPTKSEDEQHRFQRLCQVCSGRQRDGRAFPLSVQRPLPGGTGPEFPGCLGLLQHPQHLNLCGLSQKRGDVMFYPFIQTLLHNSHH